MTDTPGSTPPFPGFPGFPPAEMLERMWGMMRLSPFGSAFSGAQAGRRPRAVAVDDVRHDGAAHQRRGTRQAHHRHARGRAMAQAESEHAAVRDSGARSAARDARDTARVRRVRAVVDGAARCGVRRAESRAGERLAASGGACRAGAGRCGERRVVGPRLPAGRRRRDARHAAVRRVRLVESAAIAVQPDRPVRDDATAELPRRADGRQRTRRADDAAASAPAAGSG